MTLPPRHLPSWILTVLVGATGIASGATDGEPAPLTAEIDWFAELLKGGVVGFVLLGLFAVMMTIALERLINLRRNRVLPPGLASTLLPLWHEGRFDVLLAQCDHRPSTLARMTRFLVEHRGAPPDLLIQGAQDMADRELATEQKKAYGLAVIAGIAPLLGLLGTIIGMIESFKLVELYGDDGGATLLAGSISKALITTALGLIIAIPSLGLYHLFKFRIQAMSRELDEAMERLVSAWLLRGPET